MRQKSWFPLIWTSDHSYKLWLLIGIGLILRLIGLNSRSLSYDDAFSIFLARRGLSEIIAGAAADTMPPLYYLVLHYWLILSQQVWFIRLLGVSLSLFAVWLVYKIGAYWLGEQAAGWAALLAAISPLMIYHSQDVRMYALLVCCQLAYLWFFTLLWERDRAGRSTSLWHWAGLVGCGSLAMYSHNVAVFVLLIPGVFLFFRKQWRLFLRLASALGAVAALAMPWLLVVPAQIAKVQRAWTLPQPGMIELLQTLMMYTASLPLADPLLAIVLFLSLLVAVILGLELRRAWKSLPQSRNGVGFLLAVLGLPPAALFLVSYVLKSLFVPRAFLISSLSFDLLAGYVIWLSWKRGVGKLVAGALIAAALISLPSFYRYQEFPRSPYQDATAYLSKAIKPGEMVVHETKLSYFPAHFYAPRLDQTFLADLSGTPNDTFELGLQQAMDIYPMQDIEGVAAGLPGIYFVTFHQIFAEYRQLGIDLHPSLAWLNENYSQAGYQAFADLDVYYFVR